MPDLEAGPFPVDALSPVQRDIVKSISEVHSLPYEMAGLAVLAVTGSLLGKGAILVDAVNDRRNYANLFVIIGAPKSTGKGALNQITEPLFEFGRKLAEEHQFDTAPSLRAEKQVAEAKLAKLVRDSANPTTSRKPAATVERHCVVKEVEDLHKRIAEIDEELREPLLGTGDTTSEALAQCIKASPDQALLIYSPEAGDFIRVALGRYRADGKADADLFLSGYSVEPYRSARVSRGRIDIVPCLTILGFVQPFLFQELFSHNEAFERGLTARLLAAQVNAPLVEDDGRILRVDPDASESWKARARDLHELRMNASSDKCRIVKATEGAREVLRAYYNEAIALRRGELAEFSDECGRWRENGCRIALGQVLSDCPSATELTEEQAIRAVELSKWTQLSTLKVMRSGRAEQTLKRAKKLRDLVADANNRIPLSRLEKNHGFSTDEVKRIAARHPGWFRIQTIQTGGRPSAILTDLVPSQHPNTP
jgi:hypothetical protein